MTTLVSFTTSSTVAFQFTATLDGTVYSVICPWNIYGERYYINIYSNNGTLVMSRPIVGSPDNYDINLLFGYFNKSTLLYRTSSNYFEINP